jgi:hypothetical protein
LKVTVNPKPPVHICITPPRPQPVPGLPNVTEEVGKKTEEAKTKRVQCIKSGQRLKGQKGELDDDIAELKEAVNDKQE